MTHADKVLIRELRARIAELEGERDVVHAKHADPGLEESVMEIADRLVSECGNAVRGMVAMQAERDAAKAEAEKYNHEVENTLNALEQAKDDLEAARAGEARAVEALKLIAAMASDELKGETSKGFLLHFCYGVKEIAECSTLDAQPALDYLDQQRREAVANYIEKEAMDSRSAIGEYYERSVEGMLEEAAALRAGKGVQDA